VELFFDAANDGFSWRASGDFQYLFPVDDPVRENFHAAAVAGDVQAVPTGYTVNAALSWGDLGVAPFAGVELRMSPAVVAQGTREWEPSVKLTWRYHPRVEGGIELGVVRLQ
jgi:hypothetical protein